MNESAVKNIQTGAAGLSLTLNESAIANFVRYSHLLEEWNQHVNLTRIPPEELVPRHYLDSLTVTRALDLTKVQTLLDVGTGAGFPGMPLKIVFPHLQVTLLDSLQKRLDFLRVVARALALEEVTLTHGRSELLGHEPAMRERFDVVTARAVASLNILAEWCLPFVRSGGTFIAMKSIESDGELEAAANAIQILGGVVRDPVEVTIPGTDIRRMLLVIDKIAPTDAKYPRSPKRIQNSPL